MLIPNEVQLVLEKLKKAGFDAYIVGGCVRDLLRARQSLGEGGRDVEPNDWDVTTNAKPEQIGKIFLRSYADNNFGTVTIQVQSSKLKVQSPKMKNDTMQKQEFTNIEITPYRTEAKYTDKRHPDEIKWAKTLEQDLGRRDFTVNAMAAQVENSKLKIKNFKIIDLFDGKKDLKNKVIRAVGKPNDRFNEDALRLMRAVRFATTLGKDWKIETKTQNAIKKQSGLINFVSQERIRDEFMKIIMSNQPEQGIEDLRKLGILRHIIPELLEGYKVAQSKHHIYDVYEHSLFSLKYAAERNFNKYVRLAALFHDIGKPQTKQGKGEKATFYNHEIVGAKMCFQILYRLKFSKKDIEKITKLVRYHLFYYNTDEVGEASVRRLVRQVGPQSIEELLQLRMCDRIGSGVPKAEPYKLRHLKYIIDKVGQDPISVKMLKINGKDIMEMLDIRQGPAIGYVLDILLGEVLSCPEYNTKKFLENEVKKICKQCDIIATKKMSQCRNKMSHKKQLSEKQFLCLKKIAEKAQKKRQEVIMKKDAMTKKKYWVT